MACLITHNQFAIAYVLQRARPFRRLLRGLRSGKNKHFQNNKNFANISTDFEDAVAASTVAELAEKASFYPNSPFSTSQLDSDML